MVNSPISCCLNTLPQNQSIYSRREKSGRGGSGLYLAKGPRTGLSTFWVLKWQPFCCIPYQKNSCSRALLISWPCWKF
jgi:hypothetical protein